MKITAPAFLALALFAGAVSAETAAEAFTAFQKSLREAASDKQLPENVRKAMNDWSERFGRSALRQLPAQSMREWLATQGESLPKNVRSSAQTFIETVAHEEDARVAELESLSRTITGSLAGNDEAATEALVQKIPALTPDRGRVPTSEREQVVLMALAQNGRLLEKWKTARAAGSAGKSLEAIRALESIVQETRESHEEFPAKLREKSRALARTLGVIPAEEAGMELRRLVEQILAAKDAKEVDPILQNLHARRDLWGAARDLGGTESFELAEKTLRFAASWQEYLAAKAAGAADRAHSVLNNLAQNDAAVPGVPRSMLLERSLAEVAAKPAPASMNAGTPPVRSLSD